MSLPLDQSVRQADLNRWCIGSLVCERIKTTPPASTIATWKEDDATYILRKDDGIPPASFTTSSLEIQLVHKGGSSSRVWAVGRQAFCKIKIKDPILESENNTITFVNDVVPQITTPKVIYAWTEYDISFLIITRIEGSTLRDAWMSLSPSQHHSVVSTVADYCDLLAESTSQKLQSATGRPVYEPYLSFSDNGLPALTHEQCLEHFSVPSATCPELGPKFPFYHPDLGPGNIMVLDGKVVGILDWEAAGYYPLFWIATKPSVSRGLDFCPSLAGWDDFEWRKRLRIELEGRGYPQASEWYMEWRKVSKSRIAAEA